jgi:hypothetical protein
MKSSRTIGAFFISMTLGCMNHAAANPFDQVINSFKKITADGEKQREDIRARQARDVGPAPANEPVMQDGKSSPDDIIRQLAAVSTRDINPRCTDSFNKQMVERAGTRYKLGQHSIAGTEAMLAAQTISDCAVRNEGVTIAGVRDIVGQLLALAAMANHRARLDTPETMIHAENAMTLLKLNATANQDIIVQLEQSGVFPAAAPVSAKTASTILPATVLATKYADNQLAFEREYNGKTLQTTGKIRNIIGSERDAQIVLDGIRRSNPDLQRLNDSVYCNIISEKGMNDVLRVAKGQSVTVKGVVKKEPFESGVVLKDCEIVR